jgi:predicted methyltransferase
VAFSQLFEMLKPGGLLGIMTKLVISKKAFETWHYIHDMTHIAFFSRRTFEYIAQLYGAGLEFLDNDVIILQKNSIQ